MQSSKILIFGGSFDPFHNGHFEILNQAEKLFKFDHIFIVPNYISPTKKTKSLTSDFDRVEMIKLAIEQKSNWSISMFELERKQRSYTINTIKYFSSLNPNSEIFLLIGLDQWNQFELWKKYDEILAKCKIIVAKRNNENVKCKFNIIPITIPGININISSTNIRQKPTLYSLNYKVLNYLNENGLYAIDRIKPLMSQKRFEHSLRVAYMAKDLMNHYDPDNKHFAFTAGIYHDIAKELHFDKQINIAENILGITDYSTPKLLHGYVGSYILRNEYYFNNQLILDAISRHTRIYDYYSTKPTLLDKVVYLADKLEPNRTDEDVFGKKIDRYRKLAYENIDKCFEELYNWLQINLSKK